MTTTKEGRQRPELIFKKNKLRHNFIKILKWLKHSLCVPQGRVKLGEVQVSTYEVSPKLDIRYPSNYTRSVVSWASVLSSKQCDI